ncbi:MAG: type 1 glutamine amidotransferase [Desulfobacteraceae bacterium]|nr:type 1 glutamine amidotransferase [Desulfobacteraceae bacterium]
MRIHYLQHVPFEGLGYIATWAKHLGHTLSATALYADASPPTSDAFDLLVIMGGPMGVYDTDQFAWLTQEKRFLEKVLRQNKPVLGICLGAQLMADVLGAKVFKNQHKEIGWHPVNRAAAASHTGWEKIFPERFDAFHWHGDTVDLPSGALHLAQSEACRHQAFYYPPAAIGLQFHLESTQESIDQLMEHCGHELVPGPYIQSRQQIHGRKKLIASSNEHMEIVLNYLLRAISATTAQ